MANVNFNASVESQQLGKFLIEHAAKADYDTVLSYAALSKAAGCDVKDKFHVLQTARKIAQRECGGLYGTVRGEGIKLLTPTEEVGIGHAAITHIRRKSTKTLRQLVHVKYDQLDDSGKVAHNVNASVLGAMRVLGTAKARDRIQGAATEATDKIQMDGIARLFINGKKEE